MKDMIRWGVIGSTGIARRRTIPEGITKASNATLVSVYSPEAQANRDVARQFGAKAAGSVGELLGAEVDAVYISSPPATHVEHAIACARAGKHVLCEKPLALDVAGAERVVRACADAGVTLGAALMMRFHAQHRAALQCIREGRLGKPVLGRAQLSCWYPPIPGAWRQNPAEGGGGSLMDMGGHCLDLLEMFFGHVTVVSCMTNRTVHGYEVEDSAVVTAQFANGALGVVDAFFCIPDAASKNVLELYGSKGSILARGTIGQGDAGEMTAFIEEDKGYDAAQARAAAQGIPINPQPVNTYRAEIEEFGRAILEKRAPENSAEVGLRSQRILAACYQSAAEKRTVGL